MAETENHTHHNENDNTPLWAFVDFLKRCSNHLTATAPNETIREGAACFSESLVTVRPKPFAPSRVPLVDCIDQLDRNTLVDDLIPLADSLPWIPSFRTTDQGRELALVYIHDMLELGPLQLGFILVGADCVFPEHQHKPQELYLVLSGTAQWRYGGNPDYQPVAPLHSLYNHPMDLHGVKTAEQPLLALYALWP